MQIAGNTDKSVVTKKYVDDSFVKKVKGNGHTFQVYAVSDLDNDYDDCTLDVENSGYFVSDIHYGDIPRRQNNGNIMTNTPVIDRDCTNKKYVDEAVSSCVPRKQLKDPSAPFDSVIAVNNSDYNGGDVDGNGFGIPNDSSYKYINVIGDELGKDVDNNGTFIDSIPRRDSKGNLFTGTPVDNEDCVNKKYVDEKTTELDDKINKRLPKLTAWASPYTRVLSLKKDIEANMDGTMSDDAYEYINVNDVNSKYDESRSMNTLALRDDNGNLWTYTPVDDEDCTNKKYVNEQFGILESLLNSKLITSIWASYKYEFDYNALYLLKSNSGKKDIEILDGDGNNVIGSLKSSYCLLILPKKTYQRTEYTVTVDGHDREVVGKVNCIFAGMTNKGSLVETNNIQMLQFEVDPTKKLSVTPSSSGISIFKVAL